MSTCRHACARSFSVRRERFRVEGVPGNLPLPLLSSGRGWPRIEGFNFNYRAVDTAAIKSIAVFGCDIDHTGVGKITKLFPRFGCGIVSNSSSSNPTRGRASEFFRVDDVK